MILLLALLLAQTTTSRPGQAAPVVVNVQGNASGTPMPVTGTLSVAGTADLAGTATFNANNVCASVITAGEQSVGFHLTAGTLDATLTPYITNQTGAINCATAGTCTAAAFSSGGTIVVTNPSGVKDVGVNVVGGVRQVQVCTTTFASGSAAGAVTATFLQAASSGGGGGGSVTQGTDPWLVAGKGTAGTPSGGVVTVQGAASMTKLLVTPDSVALPANQSVNVAQLAGTTTDTNSGAKSAGTLRVVLATDQPALTNKLLVTPDSVALPANQSVNVNQIGGNAVTTLAAGEQKVGVEGLAASGAAKSGNPLQSGAVFNTTQPTVTNGQVVENQATARGALIVAPGVDGFAVTGTVTTTPPSNASTNVAQFGGTNVSTGTGASGAGIPRVTVANDSNVLATQSGTWTVQQGTPPWTTDLIRVNGTTMLTGNGATGLGSMRVTIASDNSAFGVNLAQYTPVSGRLPVDGSGVTQPVSGTFWQATQPVSGTVTAVQPTGTNLHIVCDSGCGSPTTATTVFTAQQALQPYAAAQQLPTNSAKTVCVRNLPASADVVWVGPSAAVNMTNGTPLYPGEENCDSLADSASIFAFTMAGATVGIRGTN